MERWVVYKTGYPAWQRQRAEGESGKVLSRWWRQGVTGWHFILTIVVAGVLLGRSSFLATLAPMGPAFMAAVGVMWPQYLLPATVGVTGGGLLVLSGSRVVTALLCFGAILALNRSPRFRGSVWMAAGLAAASLLLVQGGALLWNTFSAFELVSVCMEAVLAFFMAYLLYQGLIIVCAQDEDDGQRQRMVIIALASSAVIGLTDVRTGPFVWQMVAGAALTLAFAFALGSAYGAAAGVVTGLAYGLGSAVTSLPLISLACGGIIAGAFNSLGRVGSMLGFLLGGLIASIYFESAGMTLDFFYAALLASAILLVVPGEFLHGVTLIKPIPINERAAPVATSQAGQRLRNFAAVCEELAVSFAQTAATTARADEAKGVAGLQQGMMALVCRGCGEYERCWERERTKTQRFLTTLIWARQMAKPLSFTGECHRQADLQAALDHLLDRWQSEHRWRQRLTQGKGLVEWQLKGLARILKILAKEVDQNVKPADAASVGWEVQTGVARRARERGRASGDSYLMKRLSDRHLLMAISDGMGFGERAAQESRAALALLDQLLASGVEPQLAVQIINSVLLLRSPEEIFATLDLAVLDLGSGEIELVKIGAPASFLLRGQEVMTIKAASLPVGILQDLEIESMHRNICAGDVLVLCSDGIIPGQEGADEQIAAALKQLSSRRPQLIADHLLQTAVARGNDDDMTVLVCRLEKKSGGLRYP
ncbi:MAG: SpoIIE family protein phosphatase [Bacillota bacterium]|jgi:stage II sporulation protein E